MSAKHSRQNEPHLSTQRESKKTTCCSCLNCFSASDSDSLSDTYLDKPGEATELLVEKMVVQRVPVRIFATEADYKKMETERGEKRSPSTAKPFEKYYSTLPKTDIRTASNTKVRPLEESDVSLHNVQVEVMEETPFFKKGKAMSEDEERQLVSTVLNTLSSLHTLDSKGVPKDPCPVNPWKRPPDAPANVPCSWRRARNSIVQVGGKTMNKELTPEMKDTLLMLGSAKTPYKIQRHPPRTPRRNYKAENSDGSFSIPSTSAAPYHDFIVLPRPSYMPDYYRAHHSNAYHDMIFPSFNKNQCCNPQIVATVKEKLQECSCPPCNCPADDYCSKHGCNMLKEKPSKTKKKEPAKKKEKPKKEPKKKKEPRKKKDASTSSSKTVTCKKSSADCTVYKPECNPSCSSLHKSIQEEPTGNQQITEIKQIKGDNLKWKIIIRHREDQN